MDSIRILEHGLCTCNTSPQPCLMQAIQDAFDRWQMRDIVLLQELAYTSARISQLNISHNVMGFIRRTGPALAAHTFRRF